MESGNYGSGRTFPGIFRVHFLFRAIIGACEFNGRLGFFIQKNSENELPSYENTKDLFELLSRCGEVYGDAPFLRWEENGLVSERSFVDFSRRLLPAAAGIPESGQA